MIASETPGVLVCVIVHGLTDGVLLLTDTGNAHRMWTNLTNMDSFFITAQNAHTHTGFHVL